MLYEGQKLPQNTAKHTNYFVFRNTFTIFRLLNKNLIHF